MADKDLRQASCLDDEAILAFRRHELSGEEYEATALHLLFCSDCTESLNSLPWEETQGDEAAIREVEPETDVRLTPSLSRAISLFRERYQRNTDGQHGASEGFNEGNLRAGQIWRTKTEGIVVPTSERPEYFSVTELNSRPHLVVVVDTEIDMTYGASAYHLIKVAPIDAEVDYASNQDLLIKEGESPLGYSIIIQLWNEQLMLQENLDVCLANLDGNLQGELLNALTLQRDEEHSNESYSLEAVIMSGRYGDTVMRYRAKEYEDTQYLRIPAQSLLETLTEEEDARDDLDEFIPALGDEELSLVSALPFLSAFQSSHLVSVGSLGDDAAEEESVKEIPLPNFFEQSLLNERLPWAEHSIRLVRDVISKEKGTARYVAYVDVRSDVNKEGTLRIVLRTREGQYGEVTLHVDYSSGIIVGDTLPSDWGEIQPFLYIEE